MLRNLVENLEKHHLTKDFLFSIKKMASGDLPVDSILHLAYLDSMRFRRIRDSRRMVYCPKMKRFWHCLYKVAGGPPVHLLSGPRGTGEQNYDTMSSSINFAVPSKSTLHSRFTNNHKLLCPGIFHPILGKNF